MAPGRAPLIRVQQLPTGERKTLGEGNFARYVPSGHLLFLLNGTLFATRFDPVALTMIGSAVPVAEGVSNQLLNAAQFAASDNGTLVYASGQSLDVRVAINWVDSAGKTSPLRETPSAWISPVFDPGGQRLAFTEIGPRGNSLWIRDLARGVDSRVADTYDLLAPAWTPNGQRITFAANRDQTYRNIYWQRVDGVGDVQRLTNAPGLQGTPAWHPDGRTLVYTAFTGARSDLMTLQMQGDERSGWTPGTPSVLFATPYLEEQPALSPDGKWIAYVGDDTGTREVYVRPFPGPGGRDAGVVKRRRGADVVTATPRVGLCRSASRDDGAGARHGGALRRRERRDTFRSRVLFLGSWRRPAGDGGKEFCPAPGWRPPGRRRGAGGRGDAGPDTLVFVFNLFDELRRLTK